MPFQSEIWKRQSKPPRSWRKTHVRGSRFPEVLQKLFFSPWFLARHTHVRYLYIRPATEPSQPDRSWRGSLSRTIWQHIASLKTYWAIGKSNCSKTFHLEQIRPSLLWYERPATDPHRCSPQAHRGASPLPPAGESTLSRVETRVA